MSVGHLFDGFTYNNHQGPVVQSPISTNPGLTLNKPMELIRD